MKNQKPLISVIAIAIMGLLITSAASISVNTEDPEDETITAQYITVPIKASPLVFKEPSIKSTTFDSIPITGGDYDEFHPSIAGSPLGGYYALTEYTEDGSIYHPLLLGSEDGDFWEPLAEYLYDDAEYTDMDQNDYGAYGTFGAPPDESGLLVVIVGDLADGFVWDFAPEFDFLSHNRISCYTFEGPEGDPGEWNWGGISLTGDNHYTPGEDIVGCPFVFYPVSAESGTIGWLTNIENCEHVGADMDTVKNRLYSAYDYYDEDDERYELIIRIDDFGEWEFNGQYWSHDFLKTIRCTDSEADLRYPSIAANDNAVIIACQKDNDVIVFYSTNGLGFKREVLVETGASFPEIEFSGGGETAVLTYNQFDQLWYRTSTDTGATWSEPELVPDVELPQNDRAVQLDQFSGHVFGTWEDERGENVDIYYDMLFELVNNDPSAPDITGSSKAGANKEVTFVFNSDDPDGDDVKFIIEWGDGTQETTDFIESGQDLAVKHIWTEKGDYIIIVKAQDSKGATSADSTFQIKIPRNKALELEFFDLFPNLYRIFQIIFG